MKKFLKFIFFAVLAIIILGVVAVSCSDDTIEESKQPASVDTPVEKKEAVKEEPKKEAVKEEPKEEKNDPAISKEEFDKIQSGMSYDEVVAVIGGEGEVMSESGSEGEDAHTVMYTWDGESGLGANANAMFQGGKLINKAQFGLE